MSDSLSDTPGDPHAGFDDDQVVERYVMGKLSAAEEARFEEHFLGCPECLERLEYAERLQAAMKRTASQDAIRLALGGAVAWLARWSRGGRFALASLAVVAIFLPGSWGVRELSERGERLASARAELRAALSPQANTPILSLGVTRGAGTSLPQLELGPGTRWAVLSLALEPPILERYRAVLDRGDDELWRADGLLPSPSDTLDLSLPSQLLPPGEYRLRVESPEGSRVSDFAFQVTDLPEG